MTPDRLDLTEQVYELLRVEMTRGRLKPGERLHVGRLSERLDVSPTPVKTALNRLIAQGFVETGRRGGSFVTRLADDEIDEVFEIRELIEQFAGKRALTNTTEDHIDRLRALTESLRGRVLPDGAFDFDGFAGDDMAFHQLLVDLGGNRRLARMYADLHVYTVVARAHRPTADGQSGANDEGRLRVYGEHTAIVAALKSRDPAALRHAISTHLRNARHFVRQAVGGERPTESAGKR
jgi:DNA-binding GntR family transcriptional regulator